jgi:hypothetical protein
MQIEIKETKEEIRKNNMLKMLYISGGILCCLSFVAVGVVASVMALLQGTWWQRYILMPFYWGSFIFFLTYIYYTIKQLNEKPKKPFVADFSKMEKGVVYY